MDLFNTIAAISTPPGEGGISVIRISGSDAIAIADKLFVSPRGKKLADCKSHTIHYGSIAAADGNTVDEVLVSVMRAPHTYTKEDVVEINCHGGIVSTKIILALVIEAGAVLASPGEFTKRAFLNGRIDLSQAESVIDIINSKTNLIHSIAVNQLEGSLSRKINQIREKLLTLLSHIQVLIDYPDEDLEPLSPEEFEQTLGGACKDIQKLLNTADNGALIRNGIVTAIVGKPNVGKSSLLNLLTGRDRAIVTEYAGTTRDAIEEYINLGDVALRIIDTAGIRDTDDVVENIGVDISKKYMQDADLVLFVTDGKHPLDDNDMFIANSLVDNGKNVIALINKTEDGCAFDTQIIQNMFTHTIMFSVHQSIGLDTLEACVKQLFDIGEICGGNGEIITNARHREALVNAKKFADSAYASLTSGIPQDMVSIDIENAISSLGEIVGLTVAEEVVDKIFHNFCLGK
ncbi:MAG: tRNA uridine-5-carboxymethylaminomethyl(34) synthesis GTPase MnmE [Clostridia bacterium]|nr:tRNA uridine-5-carboxymethylaminomethyl(34) synthesis GTPase MnmE [Clostridia bacterium]